MRTLAITVDISRLNQLSSMIGSAMPDIIEKVATEVLQEVEKRTPMKTGNLRSNWIITKQGNNYIVENDTSYARYVVEGTRPHDIFPRNSSVLAFQWHGNMVFAKRVHHPGTSPNPFVEDAVHEVENNLDLIVERGLREAGLI